MKGNNISPTYLSKIQFNFEQTKGQISLNIKTSMKQRIKENSIASSKNLALDEDYFSDANLIIDRRLIPKKIYLNQKRIPIYRKQKKLIDKSQSEVFYQKINLKKRNKTELKQQLSTLIMKQNPQAKAEKEFKSFNINHFNMLERREPFIFLRQQKGDRIIKNNHCALTPNINARRKQSKSHREVERISKISNYSVKNNMLGGLLNSNREQTSRKFQKYREFIDQKNNIFLLKQDEYLRKPKPAQRSTTEVNGWDDVDIFNSNKNGIIEYASNQT